MADDWIKMRVGLWTNPKVVTLASRLAVTRCHAVGALYCAWCIADQHADESGTILMSASALDSLCETPGLCAAMELVGWLTSSDMSLQFIGYQQHNGTTAKQRANAAKRQRASRSRHATVTVTSRSRHGPGVTREEKRRIEKKEPPIPPEVDRPDFREAWESWKRYRREKDRKALTPTTQAMQLGKLASMGPERAVACIGHSITQGWTGLFEATKSGANGKHVPTDEELEAKYGAKLKGGGS